MGLGLGMMWDGGLGLVLVPPLLERELGLGWVDLLLVLELVQVLEMELVPKL